MIEGLYESPELNSELGIETTNTQPHWDYLNKTYGNNYIVNGSLKSRPLNKSTFDSLYSEGRKLGIPYNTLIAIMANVALESGGYEDQRQINWNHKKGTPWTYLNKGGTGLIQYTGTSVPKNQRQSLYDSILKPYNSQTNYWGGRDTYRSGLQKGIYNLNDSIKHYRTQYVRPGKSNLPGAYDIGNYFSKIYKKYRSGGKLLSRKLINKLK